MATPHIESNLEDIAPVVLMPGDPLRAKYIADHYLEDVKLVNKVRNMFAYTGYYKGKKVTVFSSGMGIPSIGIYSYELYKFYDVEKIIRIGTCGSFHPDIKILDVILSEEAFSYSSYGKLLDGGEDRSIPSSHELNQLIISTAKEKDIPLKVGKTITSDVFDVYCDSEDDFRRNFTGDYLTVEMEAYGLFYNARKLGKEATCLMTVVDSLYDKRSISSEMRETSLNQMIEIALESII